MKKQNFAMGVIEILKLIKFYIEVGLGQRPYKVIRPGQAYVGNYRILYPLSDITITTLTDDLINEGSFQTGDVLLAGIPIYGQITSVEISEGMALLYE